MTHVIRLPPLAGAMAIAVCLATLAILAPNDAAAQGSAAQAYYNGYGAGYNSGYQNGYGYTGYGSGPYAPYGYPSSSRYGYQSGTYNGLDYRALRLHGRTIYTTRFYDPYGGY